MRDGFEDALSSGVNNATSELTSAREAIPSVGFVGPAKSSFELLVTNKPLVTNLASVGGATDALVVRENAQVGSTITRDQKLSRLNQHFNFSMFPVWRSVGTDRLQYDDLVVRSGSRQRGGGNVGDDFDNVVLPIRAQG